MSTSENAPGARAPQRERGKQRVAALLRAATDVFVEKGYAAATMTEVAARAQAPIGSLYQFFPNKDVLAQALMRHYLDLVSAVLATIEKEARALSAPDLAEALLNVFVNLKRERALAVSLLDRHPAQASSRSEFRETVLEHLRRIANLLSPRLDNARRDATALAVLHQMKAAAAMEAQSDAASAAARHELRDMLTWYLAHLNEGDALAQAKSARKSAKTAR